MCLAFMLLLYPRLVAAVLVLIIRLFIRALTLVVGRLLMELWAETRSLCGRQSTLAGLWRILWWNG